MDSPNAAALASEAMALSTDPGITQDELRLAARNHGMPLEALRWPITPVGLHYLLIHYDVPLVDPAGFRLEVTGAVAQPLVLTLDELRARPAVEMVSTFECAGNGRALLEPRPISQPWLTEAIGTARWRGVPLATLLEEAGPSSGAVDVVFAGLDRGVEGEVEQRYERSLPVSEAMGASCLVAYEMNGGPLPPQHGYPLRLVVPGWYGMTNVKWLTEVRVVEEPFTGYQVASGYRVRQTEEEEGRPVTRMRPRSLMAPPGIPDFDTRDRIAVAGSHLLEGRAWSGRAPIGRVEVSVDDGRSLGGCRGRPRVRRPVCLVRLDVPLGWRRPGEHVLCTRATDETGDTQPLEPEWNIGGYENNAVQRVRVHVD